MSTREVKHKRKHYPVNGNYSLQSLEEKITPRNSNERNEILAKMVGNYFESSSKEISIHGGSNFGSGSAEDEQRSRLKQHLINRIDFMQKNANSDRSLSPHMMSIYSRQAHMVSPKGVYRKFEPSSQSSNQSVGRISHGISEQPRRFIAQGLAITNSKVSSRQTDKDLSVYSHENEEHGQYTISPAIKYREMRNELRNNGPSTYLTRLYHQSIQSDNILNIKPVPKSFKSSIIGGVVSVII